MQRKKASIKQISEATGYSATTVFNALNGKGGVSLQTAQRILRVAGKMEYTPKDKKGRIKMVVYKETGSVVDDTPFFTKLFAGIGDESRRYGYNLEVTYLDRQSENYELVAGRALLEPVDGIVLIGTEIQDKELKMFENATVPVVLCDNHIYTSEIDSVSINNKDSVQKAVSYLIENGHETIGYLKGSARINNFHEREEGYQAALERNGLTVEKCFNVPLTPSVEGAYQDMDLWLRTHQKLPTAFFADNDLIAFGAMKALKEHGYHIPEDVSVIGFDDMPFCEAFMPPLSTVRVYKEEMGRRTVRRLIELIEQESELEMPPITIQIGTTLVLRDSVKKIKVRKGENTR